VAIEQAASLGWDRYVGLGGAILAMHSFGASAPFADLKTRFGFTADHLYEAAKAQAVRGKP
jgi:transketolase